MGAPLSDDRVGLVLPSSIVCLPLLPPVLLVAFLPLHAVDYERPPRLPAGNQQEWMTYLRSSKGSVSRSGDPTVPTINAIETRTRTTARLTPRTP